MLMGKKVRLRAVEREDLPAITAWFNDPQTRATLASYRPLSLADESRWYEAIQTSQTDQVFAFEAENDGAPRLLGTCGIHRIDWKNRGCLVGILVGRAADRGKGYGTDAMHTLVKYAHGELGLVRVELEVFPTNTSAVRSYQKLGFLHEGDRRHAYFRDGRFQSLSLMSVLPGELKDVP